MPPASRSYRVALLLVLCAGLAVRLGWALSRPTDEASLGQLPDQAEYLTLARSLLGGSGLTFYDDRFRQSVLAYRMPGYPAFLAACGGSPAAARAAQAVIDTSTALAAALLTAMLLPARAAGRGAVVAAAVVAVNPFLVFFAGLLLSETLFAAMLAWGMVLLLAGARGGRFAPEPVEPDGVEESAPSPPTYHRRGTLLWLAGGLLVAGSALVRPSAPPLTVLLGVLAGFAARPADRGVPPFRPLWPLPVATTMLLLTVAVLAPWAYRNSRVLPPHDDGSPSWVWATTNGGATAYDGFNPDATGASDQSVLKSLPQLKTMNEVERSDYLAGRAARFARENPRRAVELAVLKAGRTWSPIPLSAEYGSPLYLAVGLLYSLPLDLLVLLGVWRGRMRWSGKLFLLAPAAYFTLVHMASVGSLRYRVPVEPPLAVLAAVGGGVLRESPPRWQRSGKR